MKVLPNGYFSLSIDGETLAKGLRDSSASGKNSNRLIQSVKAIGKDGTIQPLPSISLSALMSNALVTKTDFPFPQIFVFDKHIIICNKTSILEYTSGTLTSKLSVSSGELWEAIGIGDFLYLSNGTVSVVRDPGSGVYAQSLVGPKCSAICNYNGQIICGNIR